MGYLDEMGALFPQRVGKELDEDYYKLSPNPDTLSLDTYRERGFTQYDEPSAFTKSIQDQNSGRDSSITRSTEPSKAPSKGAWNKVAGMVGTGVQALNTAEVKDGEAEKRNTFAFKRDIGSTSYNTSENWRTYDKNVEFTREEGKRAVDLKNEEEGVKSTFESLPIIGGWSKLGRATHGVAKRLGGNNSGVQTAIDGVFDPIGNIKRGIERKKATGSYKKQTETDRKSALSEEYSTLVGNDLDRSRAASIKRAFNGSSDRSNLRGYAFGGDTDIDGGKKYEEFVVGGTHEQNEQGGVKIGEDTRGKPNTVEQGEVVVSLPGRKKYVFSNRI